MCSIIAQRANGYPQIYIEKLSKELKTFEGLLSYTLGSGPRTIITNIECGQWDISLSRAQFESSLIRSSYNIAPVPNDY